MGKKRKGKRRVEKSKSCAERLIRVVKGDKKNKMTLDEPVSC